MCFREIRGVRRFCALGYYAAICLILCCTLDAGGTTLYYNCPESCRCIKSPNNATGENILFSYVVCGGAVDDLRLLKLPKKIDYLDLSNISLQSIPSYFFLDHGIVELTELDLSRNNLSYIDRFIFIGLNKLKYLDLSYNKIIAFDPGSLLYNTELTHIYLKGTDVPLTTEGSLIVSNTLKLLDVSDCRISSLPTLVFSEVPYLLVLNISRNPISRVDVKILDNLTWLRELDISKTNLRCDSQFAPLADWAKSRSTRLTGYPCLNSHHDQPVYKSNQRKPPTSEDDGPEWPTPESAEENPNDLEEAGIARTKAPTELHKPGGTDVGFGDTVGLESGSELTFWVSMFSEVNWTFWLMCIGFFTLGVALTIAMGYACYHCCKTTEEQTNECVSAGDDFQLVHSELGYEDHITPDEPPSYSSLFSSRYHKVLPTPQPSYGRRFNR